MPYFIALIDATVFVISLMEINHTEVSISTFLHNLFMLYILFMNA